MAAAAAGFRSKGCVEVECELTRPRGEGPPTGLLPPPARLAIAIGGRGHAPRSGAGAAGGGGGPDWKSCAANVAIRPFPARPHGSFHRRGAHKLRHGRRGWGCASRSSCTASAAAQTPAGGGARRPTARWGVLGRRSPHQPPAGCLQGRPLVSHRVNQIPGCHEGLTRRPRAGGLGGISDLGAPAFGWGDVPHGHRTWGSHTGVGGRRG